MSFPYIHIHSEVLKQFISYCKAQLPYEACGLFFGVTTENMTNNREYGGILISKFVPIPNEASISPESRFRMRPDALIQALYQIEGDSHHQLAGIAHSHPYAPAIPSQDDLNTMWSARDLSHWIVSLADPENPDIKAYRYLKGAQQRTAASPLAFFIFGQKKDPGMP